VRSRIARSISKKLLLASLTSVSECCKGRTNTALRVERSNYWGAVTWDGGFTLLLLNRFANGSERREEVSPSNLGSGTSGRSHVQL
jgi:hypothetical protein